jgi:Ala-tRNA(Pro) deacylase
MPVNPRLLAYLTRSGARYTVYPHDRAFSSPSVTGPHPLRIPDLARVAVVRDAVNACSLVVLPASAAVQCDRIGDLSGSSGSHLVDDTELARMFPDCEPGTAPPFGHLYGYPTVVDPCLLEADRVYFAAGNRREVVGMTREEFMRLARPTVAPACLHEEPARQIG